MSVLSTTTAIVTGGGRGLGRAIAERIASAGGNVVVTGRSQAELLATTGAIGARAHHVRGDVTRKEDVLRTVTECEARFGAPTLLVHNAGITGPFGPPWESDPDAWWQAQEVHLRGALLFTHAVVPKMIARGGGRVLVVASLAGLRVHPGTSSYNVSKAALIRFTEHVAAEGRASGIVAFSVDPGTVYTDLAARTVASPDAQRWVPAFVERIAKAENDDPAAGARRFADLCLALAGGAYDALSGSYVSVSDDLDALLTRARAGSP